MGNENPTAKESLKQIREELEATIQMQASLSLIMKARFDALQKVGFSEEQALFLCKL